jgi:hypothetical protein
MNPLQILIPRTNVSYEKLPLHDPPSGTVTATSSGTSSPFSATSFKVRWKQGPRPSRFGLPRLSLSRLLVYIFTIFVFIGMISTGAYRRHRRLTNAKSISEKEKFHWEHFPIFNGFYSGLRNIVPISEFHSEQAVAANASLVIPTKTKSAKAGASPSINPIAYNPYPKYNSTEYLEDHYPVHTCYLDEEETIAPVDIYAYPGVPQNMTDPLFGSYDLFGMNNNVCFERFGRYGPYGFGYEPDQGGIGAADNVEKAFSSAVMDMNPKVNWKNISWASAQRRCIEKNKHRFRTSNDTDEAASNSTAPAKKKIARQAWVLRTYTDYKYTDVQMLSLRAMINELALKSGGEYDVHFLVHVRDNSIPIWASDEIYQETMQKHVPKEFWGMATLWSEQQMMAYYPDPFPDNVENDSKSEIHGVYRSAHFALQYFAQQHPEYDFFWNWEMDLRYSGHHYEFNNKVTEWAKKQPRKGMWERSSRFWIPGHHGSWDQFTERVEEETFNSSTKFVWGPAQFESDRKIDSPKECIPPTTHLKDNYQWGVGEEADMIVFNPIFDPENTNWVFRHDITGYNRSYPIPPRRVAIITVARLSKRLLNLAHEETWRLRHHMFPEMWPPSVALHHGLKAIYAPHPVFFDRAWPLDVLDDTFNHPRRETDSPFGWGEHNLLGSSFYYNAGFSGALWRRWLGNEEEGKGGQKFEEKGSGRLCLRPTLFHPIKNEGKVAEKP